MSWLKAIWSGLTAKDDQLYRSWDEAQSAAGEAVTARSVLGLSTAWACVTMLGGTIGSLSREVYQRKDGIRVPIGDHPLQRVLDDPNADQTPIDFWEMMVLSLELWGNAFAEIERNREGTVIALVPIRPETMRVKRTTNGALNYRWNDGKDRERGEGDILHIRGNGGDALGGMSTIAWNRNTFGSAQAIEKATSATFRNGVRSTGAFISERDLTKQQMADLQDRVSLKHMGAMNSGRPLFLNNGLKWQPISFNPEEAQMLESRGFSVEEICRVFGVPPFAVGHTEKVTSFGSGLEQQLLWFQKTALSKRAKKIEQSIRKQLMSAEDRRAGYGVRHNFEDFLRTDSKARAEFYKVMLDSKVYTINEVRGLEGKPPVAWGDAPWVQMQDRQIGETPEDEE